MDDQTWNRQPTAGGAGPPMGEPRSVVITDASRGLGPRVTTFQLYSPD
jgi:hypothetical protein